MNRCLPWRLATVADICEMKNGHGFGPEDWSDQGLPIIRIQNLNGGRKFDYFAGVPEDRWLVETGELLFSWAGTKGVSFGPFIWRGPRGVLNQHIFKVTAKAGVDIDWLYWALRHVTDRIESQAHGFKATLVHVKKSDIYQQPVQVPAAGEQRRIARILSTWDAAVVSAERLLQNSQVQLKALLDKTVLVPARQGIWPMQPIDTIADRVQRHVEGDDQLPVLMISSGSGFVRQDEKYGRYMAGKSVENYIALQAGEFAYNKGNSKRYEFGCVFPLRSYERGLVPHVYVCFRLHEGLHAAFFEHLFAADYLHDQLGALVNTGVRNNGLLNIRPADFLGCLVPVPPLDAQTRVASILDAGLAQIAKHDEVVQHLREEKAALMAQLLTGKRRVRLPGAEAYA